MTAAIMRPVISGLVILIAASATEAATSHLNGTRRIPEIQQGQACVKGQVYRMDCNTCHCGDHNTLLCTKMACLKTGDGRRAEDKEEKACVPGKLFKRGCQKCFCTEKAKLKCSSKNCTLVEEPSTNPEHITPLNSAGFYKLPALPHTSSECKPGVTYRIDCNTCFCLATANLMCQKLLCPSYEDVYRFKAKEMTGKSCDANTVVPECLACECLAGKYKCEPVPACKHTDGRRMLHGEFPSKHDRNFIDLDSDLDGKKEQCQAGMVYKVHCNKCYCQDDRSLRCTQKTCLNYAEVQRLKKLRLKLEKEEEEEK